MKPEHNRLAVFAVMLILGSVGWALWESSHKPHVSLQDEYQAYRMCMQSAHVCKMTVEDYMRYHEVKRLLEQQYEGFEPP